MVVQQLSISNSNWESELKKLSSNVDLFLLFVSTQFIALQKVLKNLDDKYPHALILGCSTAGEINDINVNDSSISLTAIKFNSIDYKKVAVPVKKMSCSFSAGVTLARKLCAPDLKHVLLFSDGLNVNGADIVKGIKTVIPSVSVTGGLAADGANFKNTFVINDTQILDKYIIGLGLYGENLVVGYSSNGGWDSFGIERLVTKSVNNVLYELDGFPALSLYKSFLGEQASNLPSSGLLFPLSVRENSINKPVVRTILGINEEEQSLTFAGNIPQGSYVRLMKANVDRLIMGAENSAINASNNVNGNAELAILISCIGRRLVLKQLIEEEVETVRNVLGEQPIITGFYSYGEIAPFSKFSPIELHNQTMTITTLSEC